MEIELRIYGQQQEEENSAEEEGAYPALIEITRRLEADLGVSGTMTEVIDATCEELIRKGARIDAHDKNGCTPLYMASMYGHHQIVSLLLTAQAPPDRANKLGWTPLITAANNGRDKCVKLLLAAGADPQKRNSDGKSAFDKVRERKKSEMSPERVECFNLLRGARAPAPLAWPPPPDPRAAPKLHPPPTNASSGL